MTETHKQRTCQDNVPHHRALCDLAPAFFLNPTLPLGLPSAPVSQPYWLSDPDLAPSGHRAFAHAVLIAWNAVPAPPTLLQVAAPMSLAQEAGCHLPA